MSKNKPSDQPAPILVRRQARPAPSCGPAHAPRPPATAAQPVAKPKPQPKPKQQPQPAKRKHEKPLWPYHGSQLPDAPLLEADVPPGTVLRLGTLARSTNPKNGRPLIVLRVPCDCAKGEHFYPWRAGWPVDDTVRSRQQPRCSKHKTPDGVWLALDPATVEQSLQVIQEGKESFFRWQTWWDSLQPSERNAISKGRRPVEPPNAAAWQTWWDGLSASERKAISSGYKSRFKRKAHPAAQAVPETTPGSGNGSLLLPLEPFHSEAPEPTP